MPKYTKLYEDNLDGFEDFKGGRQANAWCPFHDDVGSSHKGFTVNLDTGLWHCFSCLIGGTAEDFIERLKINFEPEIEYDRIKTLEEELLRRNQEIDYGTMSWPVTFEFITGQETGITRSAGFKYLTETRGMALEQILRYRLGYCIDGPYAQRVILPVFGCDDELVYFTARSIARNPKIPYKNPAKTERKRGKSEVLFNYGEARKKTKIVICEGIFDAIAVGRNAVAVLGKTLSSKQHRMLRDTKATEFIIALDGDANRQSRGMAEALAGYGKRVKVADIPRGFDPDNLPRLELSKAIASAVEITLEDTVKSILEGE